MHRPDPRPRRRHGVLLPVLLAAAVLLAACRADVDVDVVVEQDGSGEVTATVTLDAAASQALIDVGQGLPLDDLAQAGWEIDPPQATPDGGTVIAASKDFGTSEQFAAVMDELDGPGGVLRGFDLDRRASFARVDHRLTGTLEPAGGFADLTDPDLDSALGMPLGELALQQGADPAGVVVRLQVDLPGDLNESASALPAPDGDAMWVVTLADDAPVLVDAATTSRLVAPLVLRGVAVVAAVLAALVLFGQGLRLFRPETRRRPTGTDRGSVPARRPAAVAPPPLGGAPAGDDGAQPAPPPKVVALDAMGVLYREGDDVNRLLIPFARERGSLLTDNELVERARALSLGRITTVEFWSQVGAVGEPQKLSQEYLALHQLNPGVVKFLRALRQRGIRAACVTNDAASWATSLRKRHSLEGLIDIWVISGAVGVRKPDPPIFEALRRVAQVPANDILLIDDDVRNLDAARGLGYRTAWFTPAATEDQANGHPVLRSLEVAAADIAKDAQERRVGA